MLYRFDGAFLLVHQHSRPAPGGLPMSRRLEIRVDKNDGPVHHITIEPCRAVPRIMNRATRDHQSIHVAAAQCRHVLLLLFRSPGSIQQQQAVPGRLDRLLNCQRDLGEVGVAHVGNQQGKGATLLTREGARDNTRRISEARRGLQYPPASLFVHAGERIEHPRDRGNGDSGLPGHVIDGAACLRVEKTPAPCSGFASVALCPTPTLEFLPAGPSSVKCILAVPGVEGQLQPPKASSCFFRNSTARPMSPTRS